MFNTKSLFIFSLFMCALVVGGYFFQKTFNETTIAKTFIGETQTAGIFFIDSINANDLKHRYVAVADNDEKELRSLRRDGKRTGKINILIVPGHDSEHKGANHEGTDEVELNRELSQRLFDFLSRDKSFDVTIAHQGDQYNPKLQEYFDEERQAITHFRSEYKKEMNRLIAEKKVDLTYGVFHNDAPSEAAFRLYGINKWANDNEIDIVLHVHFNDYPGRYNDIKERYNGFALYIPESQFSNSKASRLFAEKLYSRLQSYIPVSNHKLESKGIIEDQELIAIGAFNTLDAISVLAEYGYIYEPQLHGETREPVLNELAYQTYVGIKSFFDDEVKNADYSKVLPYRWRRTLEPGDADSHDVLALQTSLRLQGFFPPENASFNDCPITGNYDLCTLAAVKSFQKENNIKETGNFGRSTRLELHNTFFD